MPVASTGHFDIVLAISDSSFESILESRLLAALPSPPVGGTGSITIGPATLTFADVSVTALFPSTGGTSFTLFLELLDARVQAGPINGSLGIGWAQVSIPTAIMTPTTPAPPTVSVVLSFDGNGVAINALANADPAVVAALPQFQTTIRTNFAGFLASLGLTNPFPIASPIPTVPTKPPAPVGMAPGLSSLTIAALPRPGGVGHSAQALAFCLTLQDRPDTPAARPAGAVALLPSFSAGAGSDGALQLDTAFVMELITTLGLRPILPGATFLVSQAGVALTAPVTATLGGLTGTVVTLSLMPPAVPSPPPPAMTLSFVFTFVLDSITYSVAGGATITLALAGSTLIVSTTPTPPVVTASVPWWRVAILVIDAVLEGALLPPDVAIANIVAASTVSAVEAATVSAIATPVVASAEAGIAPAATLPPVLGTLLGTVALTPPLTFDDLRLPAIVGSLSLAGTYRRADSESLASTGESIDLDSGARTPFVGGQPVPGFGDLNWAVFAGLTAGTGARLIRINRDFNALSVTEVSDAITQNSTAALSPADIPVLASASQSLSVLPSPTVICVRTNTGRLGKCALWQSVHGTLVLRYLIWDTRAAACRILPLATHWTQTNCVRDPDTPGPNNSAIKHERFAHSAMFDVQATRVSLPLQVTWRLGASALTGAGTAADNGVTVAFRQQGSAVELDVGLGDSLDQAPLSVEITDADGRYVTDTRVLSVRGARDVAYMPGLEDAVDRNMGIVRDAAIRDWQSRLRERVDLGAAPGRPPDFLDVIRGPQEVWADRLTEGGYTGSPDDIPIR